MSGRNEQVVRIYTLLRHLEASRNGLTVIELLDRLSSDGHSTTKRTIYRDLEALEQAGFPLHSTDQPDGEGARWKLEQTKSVNGLSLSARELLALYLCRGIVHPLKLTPFFSDLQNIFQKIDSIIGPKGKDYFSALQNEFTVDQKSQWALGLSSDIVDTLHAAVSEKQQLRIEYFSHNKSEKSLRTVGPQFLYFGKGSLYLIAEDLKDQKIKTFAVPRISKAEMLDATYDGATLDPDTFFANVLGIFKGGNLSEVQIEFSSRLAGFVKERSWHPSQKVVSLENGKVRLALNVEINIELAKWVLSFGSDATVKSPTELKQLVQEEAKRLLKHYDGDAA